MTFFPKYFNFEKFNLLHWDSKSIKRSVELEHVLNNYNIQICSLNETKSSSKNLFKIYRNDRYCRGEGMTFILRKQHRQLTFLPLRSLEAVDVTVCSTSLKLCKLDLKKLFFFFNYKTIILGYFNSPHIAMNCSRNSQADEILLICSNSYNFHTLVPDQPTYFHPSTSTSSMLDLIIN